MSVHCSMGFSCPFAFHWIALPFPSWGEEVEVSVGCLFAKPSWGRIRLQRQVLTNFCDRQEVVLQSAPLVHQVPYRHNSHHQSCPLSDQRGIASCHSVSQWSCSLPARDLVCCDWLPYVVCTLCSIIGKWVGQGWQEMQYSAVFPLWEYCFSWG